MTAPVVHISRIGKSARSVIAESLLNRIGTGRFRAYAARSRLGRAVHRWALKLRADPGLPTAGLRPKPRDGIAGADGPPLGAALAVCDNATGEVRPIWPGTPVTAQWSIGDPGAVDGSNMQRPAAFVGAFRRLKNRIDAFAALTVASRDRVSRNAEGTTNLRLDVA